HQARATPGLFRAPAARRSPPVGPTGPPELDSTPERTRRMKCDQCEQEATVHEVTIKAGKKVERHLCERCARKQGIAVQPQLPINELINKSMIPAGGSGAPPVERGTVCGACGPTSAEFRQSGLLGCPDCYRTFEAQLGPLLERAHEGGTHHVGKF